MHAVSQETGIPANTLRSWERRYGFPTPSRGDGERRIYSERDIAGLAWLRLQTARGQGISEAIAMLRKIHESIEQSPATAPAPSLPLVSTLTGALLAGDLAAAQVSWDKLALSVSPEGLIEHVLIPAYGLVSSADRSRSIRLRADSFLLRKAIVLFDAAAPDTGSRDVAILTHGSVSAIPAHALATVLARGGDRIHGAISDLADAASLVSLRELPANTLVILVTDRPDTELIGAAAGLVGENNLYLWWPFAAPHHNDPRWLPASMARVREGLPDRA